MQTENVRSVPEHNPKKSSSHARASKAAGDDVMNQKHLAAYAHEHPTRMFLTGLILGFASGMLVTKLAR
jgi:hypothetical protein